MDPQTDLPDLVEDLEVNIDELSDALQPLLETPLHTTASSLPLLDKAKLYVLTAYSIESLLFSALQANGVNAKEHAIFPELARLKGYYGKIKEAEERDLKPKSKVDVAAAQRFIKHGLSGNDKYDLKRAERMAKKRARAALKAKQINKKFDENGEAQVGVTTPKKRGIEEMSSEESEEGDEGESGELEAPAAEPAMKRLHISSVDTTESDSIPSNKNATSSTKSKKHKKHNKGKKSKENTDVVEQMEDAAMTRSDSAGKKRKDKKKHGRKQSKQSND